MELEVNPGQTSNFELLIRVPGWARNEAVPSDLYRFQEDVEASPVFYVNDQKMDPEIERGYAKVARKWEAGDKVKLELPMPVRKVRAHQKVDADRNRMALQRGPLVYALEGKDNGGHVSNLVIEKSTEISVEEHPDMLKGIHTLSGAAKGYWEQEKESTQEKEITFTAIPYYAWNNRGPDEMGVWMPFDQEEVRPVPAPTKASAATITAADGTKNIRALNDQQEPDSSDTAGMIRTHWWPEKNKAKWVQYSWDAPQTISSTKVYWFDDRPYGGVRIPESWKIMYKDGEVWKPVQTTANYSVTKDAYDRVSFDPVRTTALRLQVQLPADNSSGILEWKIE